MREKGGPRRTHGFGSKRETDPRKKKIYIAWQGMIWRCHSPSNWNYPRYGARGITVCDEWRHSFERFFADMGYVPEGKSLGRIDNNAGYCKENCRWETLAQQSANRRTSRYLTFRGRTQTVTDWERELGFNPSTLFARLVDGWSVEKALTTPVGKITRWRKDAVPSA